MGLRRAFGRIATANVLFAVLTFVSSPIAAHALGPTGRGHLAAVLVPFGWANVLFQFGLPAYAQRAAARNDAARRGAIFGTLFLLAIVIGACAALTGFPTGWLVAPHAPQVRHYIAIGFLFLPLTLAGEVCIGLSKGEEKWRWLMWLQLTPQILILLGYLSLLVLHVFTFQHAVLVAFGASIVTSLLAIRSVGRVERPRADRSVSRETATFSPRAWIGSFANYANVRLDQLLMVPLVSATQLGLYAIAVTLSALDGLVLGAMGTVMGPSIARGQHELVSRAVRLTIAVDLVFSLALAASLPFLVPILFGERFAGSVPMGYVLLAGSVPGAAAWTMGQALQNAGHPDVPAVGEAIALAVTVPGLLVLLPQLQAMGAAMVSSLAYGLNFAVQVALARRHLGCSIRELTVPTRRDLAAISALIRTRQ